jgi:hypothetical protein
MDQTEKGQAEPANEQEKYSASTRGEESGQAKPAPTYEQQMLEYAKQTRNAAVFIGWVVGIVAVLSLIGVIITGVELSHLTNAVNGGGSSSCIPGIDC